LRLQHQRGEYRQRLRRRLLRERDQPSVVELVARIGTQQPLCGACKNEALDVETCGF